VFGTNKEAKKSPFQLKRWKRILHTVTCEMTDADAILGLPRYACRTPQV
jgi:hypothetical protein